MIRDDDFSLELAEHLTITITIIIIIIDIISITTTIIDIIIIRDDDFPLELAEHLTLEQCESLIPSGPGGWRKVILMIGLEIQNHHLVFQTSAVLQCLLREARDSRKEAAIVRSDEKFLRP